MYAAKTNVEMIITIATTTRVFAKPSSELSLALVKFVGEFVGNVARFCVGLDVGDFVGSFVGVRV